MVKFIRMQYNEETGEFDAIPMEEEGDLVFSTHTNVPVEKLKRKKNEDRIPKNKKEYPQRLKAKK